MLVNVPKLRGQRDGAQSSLSPQFFSSCNGKAQRQRQDWFHKFWLLLTNRSITLCVCLRMRLQLLCLCFLFLFFFYFSHPRPRAPSFLPSHSCLFFFTCYDYYFCPFSSSAPVNAAWASRRDFCAAEINRGDVGERGFISPSAAGSRFSLHCKS